MPAIIIDGKNLNDCSAQEAFLAGADPARPIFQGGERMDYQRNIDVLRAFGERETVGVDLAIERYLNTCNPGSYSFPFNALRAGELMNWACRHGIVERIEGPAWRLIERDRQFELVGPENKQHALRVRGLPGPEAVVAAKIWDRELKRRERARQKRVAAIAKNARFEISKITKYEPDHKLGEELASFAIGSVDTIAAAADYICDTIVDLAEAEARAIASAVNTIFREVCAREVERAAAERRERDAAAMAELTAIFAAEREANPPPPPRPPRVPTAEVVAERRGNMSRYTVTGSLAGVNEEVAELRDTIFQTSFLAPVEIAPGQWRVIGSIHYTTD